MTSFDTCLLHQHPLYTIWLVSSESKCKRHWKMYRQRLRKQSTRCNVQVQAGRVTTLRSLLHWMWQSESEPFISRLVVPLPDSGRRAPKGSRTPGRVGGGAPNAPEPHSFPRGNDAATNIYHNVLAGCFVLPVQNSMHINIHSLSIHIMYRCKVLQ